VFRGLSEQFADADAEYRSPEVLLGLPYDTSADMRIRNGRSLFDPELDMDGGDNTSECSDNNALVDVLHLSIIEQVIGPISEDWARQGSAWTMLYRNGELLKRCDEELPAIIDQLVKHRIPEREATQLADFLAPMLSTVPEQRPTAADVLYSPWPSFVSQ
jgi:serine/threonine protein kinase